MEKNQQSKRTDFNVIKDSRRDFLKKSAAIASYAAIKPLSEIYPLQAELQQDTSNLTGIQVGAISFLDEGTENVLDIVQKRGAVNSIYLSTFNYINGVEGRAIEGKPIPDHGVQDYNKKRLHGGNYATPHSKFYKNTSIKGEMLRAPDYGNLDIIAEVLPAAKKRGMKVYSILTTHTMSSSTSHANLPFIKDAGEVDLLGRKKQKMCPLRPDVQAFWIALVTDLCTSYEIDGICIHDEYTGPLLPTMRGASPACFCEHHQRVAREQGINFDRAKEGYQKFEQLVQAALKDQRPSDGYYVEFNRLFLKYPEIEAYSLLTERFGKNQLMKEVSAAIKSVNNNLQFGLHIEHTNSFFPFYRMSHSYEDIAATNVDYLKIVVYNNCGGERYIDRFINGIGQTLYRDVPRDELYRFNNYLLNYHSEADLGELASAGLSPDYVLRETQRAVVGVQKKCRILSGIDIGIPTDRPGPASRIASPEDTYAAVQAAYKGGADGVILSRKYSEMMLANLDAAGRAIRDVRRGVL